MTRQVYVQITVSCLSSKQFCAFSVAKFMLDSNNFSLADTPGLPSRTWTDFQAYYAHRFVLFSYHYFFLVSDPVW